MTVTLPRLSAAAAAAPSLARSHLGLAAARSTLLPAAAQLVLHNQVGLGMRSARETELGLPSRIANAGWWRL
jgi:hypothetical protein